LGVTGSKIITSHYTLQAFKENLLAIKDKRGKMVIVVVVVVVVRKVPVCI
jgi:hypothetical protein